MELSDLKTRLNQYIKHKYISVRSLEKMAGLSDGSLAKYLSDEKRDIYMSAINKILDACKDLNPHWLIAGEEPMIIDTQDMMQIITSTGHINVINDNASAKINSPVNVNQTVKSFAKEKDTVKDPAPPPNLEVEMIKAQLAIAQAKLDAANDKINIYESHINSLKEIVEILKKSN